MGSLSFLMSAKGKTKPPIPVTLLVRDDCNTCADLLNELRSLPDGEEFTVETINLNKDEPPSFATGTIVPATYVREQLWRYGLYSHHNLHDRLIREYNDTLHTS